MLIINEAYVTYNYSCKNTSWNWQWNPFKYISLSNAHITLKVFVLLNTSNYMTKCKNFWSEFTNKKNWWWLFHVLSRKHSNTCYKNCTYSNENPASTVSHVTNLAIHRCYTIKRATVKAQGENKDKVITGNVYLYLHCNLECHTIVKTLSILKSKWS